MMIRDSGADLKKMTAYASVFVAISLAIYGPHFLSSGFDLGAFIGADAADYAQFTGGFNMVFGHFLTLAASTFVSGAFLPVQGWAMLAFFSIFLAFSMYFFLDPLVENSWLVFVLLPFSLLMNNNIVGAAIYGQIFSLSIFLLGVGFLERGAERPAAILFIASILAHFWTGVVLFGVLALYFVYSSGEFDERAMISVGAFLVALLFGIPFVETALSMNASSSVLDDFLILAELNFGILVFAAFGVWKNLKKAKFFGVWAAAIGSLMVIFYGLEIWRMWSLMPIFPLAVLGASWTWEKDRLLFGLLLAFTVLSVGVMI